jgi:hypothetical protein
MKKLLLTILLMVSNFVNAAPIELKNVKETVTPFPNAKEGINIVPLAELNAPTDMKNQILAYEKVRATKGYRDTNDTDENVVSLFKLQENAKEEIAKFDNNKNPYDTHLKSSASKIKLAFYFSGIPKISKDNVIGYAAAGSYSKGKGWEGIVEFITDSKLGICSYTTYKIGKVIFDKEKTEYLVNNKLTDKDVAGNWNVGFMYTVNWYTSNRFMSLECANKMYEPANISKMISLAKEIDRQNSE